MSSRNDSPRPFLVTPETVRPHRPHPLRELLIDIALDGVLIPLALIFVGVVCLGGYLCMNGVWEKAKDFLCIFLPPITALLGVATAAAFGPDRR